MEGQMSLFDDYNGKRFNEAVLDVMEVKCVSSELTDYKALFTGFKYLYAVTFSYGLKFIDEISDYFEKVEVILGCEALIKYDIQEIMAFQANSLKAIRRHKSLIKKVEEGRLSFGFNNNIVKKVKEKILFEYEHNRKAFIVKKKTNTLEYIAGEKKYEADRICNDLPEFLEARTSGVKVIMKLDKAEDFFGIKFQRRLF